MPKFAEWKSEYSVGVSSLDQQHKSLLEMVNNLHSSQRHGPGAGNLQEAINFLQEYSRQHFCDEEKYMAAGGFPDLERHKKLHADYTRKAGEILRRLEGGAEQETFFECMKFLKGWWMSHIKIEDKKYKPFLKKLG